MEIFRCSVTYTIILCYRHQNIPTQSPLALLVQPSNDPPHLPLPICLPDTIPLTPVSSCRLCYQNMGMGSAEISADTPWLALSRSLVIRWQRISLTIPLPSLPLSPLPLTLSH